MKKSTDLRPEDNHFASLVRLFKEESRAVTIAGLALIVSCLALLASLSITGMALYVATDAKNHTAYQDQRLEAMQRQIETQDAKLYTIKGE